MQAIKIKQLLKNGAIKSRNIAASFNTSAHNLKKG